MGISRGERQSGHPLCSQARAKIEGSEYMRSETGWIVCMVYLVYLVCLVAGLANPPGRSKDRETKEEGGLEGLPLRAIFSPAHPLARRDVPLARARACGGRALREHRRSSGSIPPVPYFVSL